MTRPFQVAGYDRKGQELFVIAVEAIGPDDAKLVAFRELRSQGGSRRPKCELMSALLDGRIVRFAFDSCRSIAAH